jgi:hypothetical protein
MHPSGAEALSALRCPCRVRKNLMVPGVRVVAYHYNEADVDGNSRKSLARQSRSVRPGVAAAWARRCSQKRISEPLLDRDTEVDVPRTRDDKLTGQRKGARKGARTGLPIRAPTRSETMLPDSSDRP